MRIAHRNSFRLIASVGIAATLLAGPLAPRASAQNVGGEIIKVLGGSNSRQGEKNAMRNAGLGLGVAAAYEALNHRVTSAVLLGAGAILAGKRYEDVRKTQSKEANRFSFDRNGVRDRDDRWSDRDNYQRENYQRDDYQNHGRRDRDNDGDWNRDQRRDHDNGWRRNPNGYRGNDDTNYKKTHKKDQDDKRHDRHDNHGHGHH